MPTVVYMPEVLANVTEAAIAAWSVTEGAAVTLGEVLAEIETEKAVVDFVSEHQGIVAKLLVEPGNNVIVGEPIMVLRADTDSDADVQQAIAALGHAAVAAEVVEAAAVTEATTAVAAATAEVTPPVAAAADAQPAAQPATQPGQRQFASPLARRLARENDIDTAAIHGTGPFGRIVRRDVELAIAAKASQPVAAPEAAATPAPAAPAAAAALSPALPEHEVSPHSRMRKTIARRLTESKTTVPHYYVAADCRVDALLQLRAEINGGRETKISVNDLVVKAIALALVAVPDANVMWTDEAMLRFTGANVAVAIATDSGLLTPVIRGADALSIGAVSNEARSFVAAARESRVQPSMLEGGTFTVSNLGMFGVPEFSAILNPPQSGILAVGAAVQQPVVDNGEIVVASVMRVTLSADHRAIDGAVAAQLIKKFQELIENPINILV